eukprot:NODE_407_length_9242_cov_0.441868.p2 type:complete len:314 gc:universal NODE_407_length_9242_cov_0.441868:3328-4269(+)
MLVISVAIPDVDIKYSGKVVKCNPDEIYKYIEDAEYILCTVTSNLLDLKKAKKLKMISTISVGVDHINIKHCNEQKIKVGYTPDVLSDAVADTAMGLVLVTTRKLLDAAAACKDQSVKDFTILNELVGTSIKNKVVGIVGLGRIGYQIAKRFSAFGVDKILYYGVNGPKPVADFNINQVVISVIYVPLNELLKNSDFVIISCALDESTTNLCNESFFKKMKNSAYFYNIARGKIVDTNALVQALESKEIAGCGLDVVDPEPLPSDHTLLKMKNVCIFPHIASANKETRLDMFNLAVENLQQFWKNGTITCQYK